MKQYPTSLQETIIPKITQQDSPIVDAQGNSLHDNFFFGTQDKTELVGQGHPLQAAIIKAVNIGRIDQAIADAKIPNLTSKVKPARI